MEFMNTRYKVVHALHLHFAAKGYSILAIINKLIAPYFGVKRWLYYKILRTAKTPESGKPTDKEKACFDTLYSFGIEIGNTVLKYSDMIH